MKNIFLALLLIKTATAAQAQTKLQWEKQADSLLAASKYLDAFQLYNNIKTTDPQQAAAMDKKIANVLAKMSSDTKSLAATEQQILSTLQPLVKNQSTRGLWAYNDHRQSFALCNEQGKLLSDFVYQKPQDFDADGFAWAIHMAGSDWAWLDKTGKIWLEGIEHYIPKNDFLFLFKNEQWHAYNKKSKTMLASFDALHDMDGAYWAKRGKQWLLLDAQLRPLPAPACADIRDFQGEVAWAQAAPRPDAKPLWGLLNKKGEWLLQPQFFWVDDFVNGVARVIRFYEYENGNTARAWGLVDAQGKVLIEPIFSELMPAQDGMMRAAVCLPVLMALSEKNNLEAQSQYAWIKQLKPDAFDWKRLKQPHNSFFQVPKTEHRNVWGAINTKGEVVIPPAYPALGDFSEGLAWFSNDWKHFQWSTNEILSGKVNWQNKAGDGVCMNVFEQNTGKLGLLDKSGAVVLKPTFSFAYDFSDSVAWAAKGKTLGLIDKTGKWRIAAGKFMAGSNFSNGLAWAEMGSAAAFEANKREALAVAIKYREGKFNTKEVNATMRENAATFTKNPNKIALIDKLGNAIIAAQFDRVDKIVDAVAVASIDSLWGLMNTKGEWLVKPAFQAATLNNNGLCWLRKNDYWGLWDKSGKCLISPQYHEVRPFNNGLAWVCGEQASIKEHFRYRIWSLIDANGKVLMQYNCEEAQDLGGGLHRITIKEGSFLVR